MEFQVSQKTEKLGKYWTVGELWLDPTMPTLVIDPKLVNALDAFKDHFGVKPKFVTPRSIYCKTGHSSGSYHYKGMAADLCIPGQTPITLAQYAEVLDLGGIGVYDGWDTPGRHIHIDVRSHTSMKPTCWWVKTTGSNTPGFGGNPNTVYKHGNRSPYLIAIQKKLALVGDGDFGDKTMKAVQKFQTEHPPLSRDGKLGPATLKALGL